MTSLEPKPTPAPTSWVVSPLARVWKNDGTSYLGTPQHKVFQVPAEMIELLLLFRRPTTLEQVEQVADVDDGVFYFLLANELLIDATELPQVAPPTDMISPPASRWGLVRSFAREMSRVAVDLFRGERLRAPRAIRERRWAQCSDCGWYIEGSGSGPLGGARCRACGCYLSPKIALNSSRCPLDRW